MGENLNFQKFFLPFCRVGHVCQYLHERLRERMPTRRAHASERTDTSGCESACIRVHACDGAHGYQWLRECMYTRTRVLAGNRGRRHECARRNGGIMDGRVNGGHLPARVDTFARAELSRI